MKMAIAWSILLGWVLGIMCMMIVNTYWGYKHNLPFTTASNPNVNTGISKHKDTHLDFICQGELIGTLLLETGEVVNVKQPDPPKLWIHDGREVRFHTLIKDKERDEEYRDYNGNVIAKVKDGEFWMYKMQEDEGSNG